MESVAGVFRSADDARRATAELHRAGFSDKQLNLLLPSASEEQVHSVPVSDTEQPGMGKTMGGVVGAALGMAGGFSFGTAAATALVPGVGPVLAVGIAAAALLGAGGAAGGAALGSLAEHTSTHGLPADEIFFYEDALRQGRSVVIVLAEDKEEAERAHDLLSVNGAESMDAAREAWWIGLRDAEAEHYQALGQNFEKDHDDYRAGFETALRNDMRGKACPKPDNEAFRQGFERGQKYREELEKQAAGSVFYGG